jgi:integrase
MIYIAPAVMAKLKEHQERQEQLRKKFGKAYMNLGMVFCREDGWYIDPKTFRDFYLRTLDKAGVDHKTFHALRHTFATRALESNANIKVVSEILGHASIQITLDTYSHVSTELQRDTMQMIADNFFEV